MEQEERKRDLSDREWQIAGDRMLLYLRCLNFAVPQALDLVLRAMKKAGFSMEQGSANTPLIESMHALHQLLSEQRGAEAPRHAEFFLDPWCKRPVHASPPIQRLSMFSEK